MSKEITVIYDGQCEFCRNALAWVEKKLVVTAIPYQSADLSQFGLTIQECATQLYVIKGKKKYGGIKAVTLLLRKRKNRLAALILKLSGPLGDKGYKWVAANRSSVLVGALNYLLIKVNGKAQ
jgi:predicted DCC family thiol-disulfide oxidoreductase YuxK